MPASTAQSTLSTLLNQHNLPPSLNPPLLSQTPPSLLHLLLSRIQGVKLPILSSEIETIKLVLGILASELTDLDLSELEPLDLVRGDEEQIGVVVLALAVLSLRRRQRQRQRKLQDPIEPDISYVSSAGSTTGHHGGTKGS